MYDVDQTLLSQYAASPIISTIIENMNEAIDPASNLVQFYNTVWNISTAAGFGLDNWGLILGVSRYLEIPNANEYFGFEGTANSPFNVSPWYVGGSTSSVFALNDAQYRQLLLAKAQANLSSCSIQALNALAQAVFGAGAMYVVDLGGMAMIYAFAAAPSVIDLAIAQSSGVLPHPTGVLTSVETAIVSNALLASAHQPASFNTGYSVSGSFGSLTPSTDVNGHSVVQAYYNSGTPSFSLTIQSATTLASNYFTYMLVAGVLLKASSAAFLTNSPLTGQYNWTWTGGTLPVLADATNYSLLLI